MRLMHFGALLVPPVAALAGLLLLGGVAAASDPVDQQQTLTSSGWANADTPQSLAQTFTVGVTGSLTQVNVYAFAYNGVTSDLTVQLETVDGSGTPTGTVLATQSFAPDAVPAYPGGWLQVVWSQPVIVTAGSQYAISLASHTPQSSTGIWYQSYAWSSAPSSTYSGGKSWVCHAGAPWFVDAYNVFAFQTFVAPANVLSSGPGTTLSDPSVNATPELDSLLLFGTGLTGLGGYALTRLRARSRKS